MSRFGGGRGTSWLKPYHYLEPVLHALRKLAESGHSRLAVVENGALVGLLCGRDVMDLLEIRAGLASPRDAGSLGEAWTAGTKA